MLNDDTDHHAMYIYILCIDLWIDELNQQSTWIADNVGCDFGWC